MIQDMLCDFLALQKIWDCNKIYMDSIHEFKKIRRDYCIWKKELTTSINLFIILYEYNKNLSTLLAQWHTHTYVRCIKKVQTFKIIS